MGMNFRKSFKFGPFRTTISKSGVSTSFGVKGARITKRADGRTQGTLSIPGTGVYYTKDITNEKKTSTTQRGGKASGGESSGGNGCLWTAIIAIVLAMLVISIGSCGAGGDTTPTTEPPSRVVPTLTVPVKGNTTTPATKPTTEPTTEPITEPTTEPTTKPTTKPTEPPEPEYDYVLNTNTKKFHYEWCSSADDIKEKNRREFTGTREEVIAKGYDPCGRCKP